MNRLLKNKFIRDNLVLLVAIGLIFPQYLFADAWVADTGNNQVSRIYKEGHAPTVFRVSEIIDPDTISVNTNPTALFYPGLKISFGLDRANVYEIDDVDSDADRGWLVTFTVGHPPLDDVSSDSPIYMELVRAGGFQSPLAASVNTYNNRSWFLDVADEGSVSQLTGWGREEPPDTPLVERYYSPPDEFAGGDTIFKLYSEDKSIYPGIKIDFKSDNRAQGYVLETEELDMVPDPNVLTTFLPGLPDNHYVIGDKAAVIHTDRFRDKTALIFPKSVSANSTSDRESSEYDIAWAANTEDNSVVKFNQWNYRKPLVIKPDYIDEDLTDFPIMVKLTPGRFDYDKSAPGGSDIRFTDEEGDELSYEREGDWNYGGTSIFWVKVSEVSSTDTTLIYMYYGNPHASDNQTVDVWSNGYLMVQHLNETSETHFDSSGKGNNSTTIQVSQQGADIGVIDGADEFDSALDDKIIIGGLTNVLTNGVDFTVTAWFRPDGSDTQTIVSFTEGVYFWGGWHLLVGSDNLVKIYLGTPVSPISGIVGSSDVVTDGNPHYAGIVKHDTEYKLYVDGQMEATDTSLAVYPVGSFYIGHKKEAVSSIRPFDGMIDEVRVSDTIRSDSWLKASFHAGRDELINYSASEDNIRYGGVLKVGGFQSPQSISVNSENGEVWVGESLKEPVITYVGRLDRSGCAHSLGLYNDKLYGGTFDSPGEVYIYEGDTQWTRVGQLSGSRMVWALTEYDGNLYAGTDFSGRVYLYNGTTWGDVGRVGSASFVFCLEVHGGNLYAGTNYGGRVYRYNGGTSWTSVGQLNGDVHSLVECDGVLYASAGNVYRYDGDNNWTNIGGVSTYSLIEYNNRLYAAAGNVYRYDGDTTWTDIGYASAHKLAVCNNRLYAASSRYPSSQQEIYRYEDGTTWTEIAPLSIGCIHSFITYDDKLYAGGCDSHVYSIDDPIDGPPAVVKLSKYGHQTINATVDGNYEIGDFQISLTDISELDSGIKISFDNRQQYAYKVSGSAGGWRMPLVFDGISSIDETLNNFPVLVKLTPSNFDYTHSLVPNGIDIRFFDADGKRLSYEIEKWRDSNDESFVWVKVPRISSTSDYIWMYYGNPNATDAQNPEDVWSNSYLMVQHLQEPSGNHIDSTGKGYYAQVFNLLPSQQGADTGIIDGADEFNSSLNSYLRVPDFFGPNILLDNPLTITALFKPDGNDTSTIVSYWTSWYNYGIPLMFGWQLDLTDTNLSLHLGYISPLSVVSGDSDLIDGQWHCAGMIREPAEGDISDTGIYRLYVDGEFEGEDTHYISYSGQDFQIGSRRNTFVPDSAVPGGYFNGVIDEVRVSNKIRSDFWMQAEYKSMMDEFIGYGAEEENINTIIIESDDGTGLETPVRDGAIVARELARVSGFANPASVSVNSHADSGDCWVADKGNNTVVWLSGRLGEYDITTAGYDMTKDFGYHRIIQGFDNPVSVSVDPLSGDCWVACEGDGGGTDSYIVRLNSDVPDGYALNGARHTKVYGFDSPNAVSVDPLTGECYVSDKNNNQIVRLSPRSSISPVGGHIYTGYKVDEIGSDTAILELDGTIESYDTSLYSPLKISFGDLTGVTSINPVYTITNVKLRAGNRAEIRFAPPLEQDVTTGAKVNKELARVGGFDSPLGLSAFKGEDLGLRHPWGLQVREFYDVNDKKIPYEFDDGWRDFSVSAPIHDATPQFRWKYINVSGEGLPLDSYRIEIYTPDIDGDLQEVWDSGDSALGEQLAVRNTVNIITPQRIYTDWDIIIGKATTRNDSTSIYSGSYDEFDPDDDDCPDLSQVEDYMRDLGDRKYYVRLTVWDEDGNRESYPSEPFFGANINDFTDSPITFTLDKTPPGAYKVCGTQELVPSIDGNEDLGDDEKYYIKQDYTPDPYDGSVNGYYQKDNYYWNEVWVEWDGGETEIVKESDGVFWVPKKQVTVRVKVKDRNNENPVEGLEPFHEGYGPTEELEEDSANCSGISLDAQYRYSLATSPESPRQWSEWFDCEEVRLYDEDALMSNKQGKRLLTGSVKNQYVWLYAKNVMLEDGDTNLVQFKVLDEGYLEVSKVLDESELVISDTEKEIWIAPNMGYSHADTDIWNGLGRDIEVQMASNTYGYKIPVDSNIPQVVLVEYPSNPYPHTYASFAWIAIDTTPCRFKWKLEQWQWNRADSQWQMDGSWDYAWGDDGAGASMENNYLNDENRWLSDATSTNFADLTVGRWYVFRIKAKDRDGALCGGAGQSPCGRRVSDEVVWVWYVSPEVPDTIITYGPSGQIEKGMIKFIWEGVGGMPPYLYDWQLKGPSTAQGDNNVSYTNRTIDFTTLPSGTYTFEVSAEEQYNPANFDPTPAKRTFTILDPSHPPYSRVSPQNLYKYFRDVEE